MCNLLTPAQYTCACPDGFQGSRCELAVSVCESLLPCNNQGTCIDLAEGEFECRCPAGFTGPLCELNIDDCGPSPCNNGGTCVDQVDSFACNCPPGFSGPTCSDRVIFCSSEPCQNGGTCSEGVGSFTCSCPPGLTGSTCEQDVNECLVNPCLNGTCINTVGGFTCFCPSGFTGPTCNQRIDFCQSNPCSANGTSTCQSEPTGFSCVCNSRYTGTRCEVEVDLCDPNPCANGICVQGGESFMCLCSPGLTGRLCEVDVDDCLPSPCTNGGTCTDRLGGFTCDCNSGFTGPTCNQPIDFCTDQTCFNGGSCNSIEGTFVCACTSGWSGNRCQYPESVVTKLASCGFPDARDMLAELFFPVNEAVPLRNAAPFLSFRYQFANAVGIYLSSWLWQEEGTNSVVFSFQDFNSQSIATLTSNLAARELHFSYTSMPRGVNLSAVFENVPLMGNTWMHLAIAIFNDSVMVNIDGSFTNATRLQGEGSLIVPQEFFLSLGAGVGASQASAFSGIFKGMAVNQITNNSSNFDLHSLQMCTVNCVGGDSFCSASGQCLDMFGTDRICRCPFGSTGLRCQNLHQRLSFDGSSFAVLNNIPDIMSLLRFSFKTAQPQGLLYSVSQPRVRTTLQLTDSSTININHTDCNQLTVTQQVSSPTDLNTLQYQSLAISDVVELNGNARVQVVSTDSNDTTSCSNEPFLQRMFLGGIPQAPGGFQGCMRDVSYNGEMLDTTRVLLSPGATFGCTHDTAQFTMFSHLELPSFISRQFQRISLEFTTRASAGLIYFSRRVPDDASGNMPNDFIAIYVQEGRAVFSFNLGEQNQAVVLRSGGSSVNDGEWHQLTATQNGTMASLYVDGVLIEEQSLGPLMLLDTTGSVFLGGVPSRNRINTFQNYDGFDGCVRDLEQNGNEVDLQSHLTQQKVRFGTCN